MSYYIDKNALASRWNRDHLHHLAYYSYVICSFILEEVPFSHNTFILISLFPPFCCDQLHEDGIDCTHEINLEATCKNQTDDLKDPSKYIVQSTKQAKITTQFFELYRWHTLSVTISPPAERHVNDVSLAVRWWPTFI